MFGRALVNALRGGACKPHSKYVTALDLFTFVRAYVAKTVDRYNALAQAEYRPEGEQPAPVPAHQSPLLFVPQGHPEMAKNPVCYKCDPPAPPEKPYVSAFFCLCAHLSSIGTKQLAKHCPHVHIYRLFASVTTR